MRLVPRFQAMEKLIEVYHFKKKNFFKKHNSNENTFPHHVLSTWWEQFWGRTPFNHLQLLTSTAAQHLRDQLEPQSKQGLPSNKCSSRLKNKIKKSHRTSSQELCTVNKTDSENFFFFKNMTMHIHEHLHVNTM